MPQHSADGAPKDAQVEQKRVVPNVVQIVLSMQVHGVFAAAAHLPPAGHARRHSEPLSLPALVVLHQQGQFRARPYQAHLSLDDVEKLGQFIQAAAPQESP